jgi:hypothetical protein
VGRPGRGRLLPCPHHRSCSTPCPARDSPGTVRPTRGSGGWENEQARQEPALHEAAAGSSRAPVWRTEHRGWAGRHTRFSLPGDRGKCSTRWAAPTGPLEPLTNAVSRSHKKESPRICARNGMKGGLCSSSDTDRPPRARYAGTTNPLCPPPTMTASDQGCGFGSCLSIRITSDSASVMADRSSTHHSPCTLDWGHRTTAPGRKRVIREFQGAGAHAG